MTVVLLLVSALAAEKDAAAFQAWLKFYGAAAAEYEIEAQDGDGGFHSLKLQPTPILQYTNPERGLQHHGASYIWTWNGRPLCIGSIWSVVPPEDPEHRWISNELHSLAAGPLRSRHPPRVGQRGPVPQWETDRPGIVWVDVPDAPEPAATASLRLVQMRRIAEQYTARLTSNVGNEKPGDLRLLTKPLYRYPTDASEALDGGLFAYVQGTDPEVLMLLEASKSGDGPRWRIGFARFTNTTAVVQRDGRAVWECDRARLFVGDHPYFVFLRIHPAGLDSP
ncbi:hypothetical protein [Planctellipticum variicoloris]|uniref:hypothetical protein n=1 Tax=Planctellipticum variicoloris TaxID=3064265 RepID=UPI00301327AC|nr:hypothetical protein SH412_001430 [Planctomycetaceae bacterium SH412]